jgi:hypothetical protein
MRFTKDGKNKDYKSYLRLNVINYFEGMLKKITAGILISIALLIVIGWIVEYTDENSKWLKNTYSLKVDTIKARIRIPKKYKDLNLDTYYDLIPSPIDAEIRSSLIRTKIGDPSMIILVDSTNARNQVHIYRHTMYMPITEATQKSMIDGIEFANDKIPLGFKQQFIESFIGSNDNFNFIKVRTKMTTTFSNQFSFGNIYLVSVNGYSFVVQVITSEDENTDVFIRSLRVRQEKIEIISKIRQNNLKISQYKSKLRQYVIIFCIGTLFNDAWLFS